MLSGVRAVDADGHASDAAGGLGDGPRLYFRDAQAAADDHVGGGQGADPDVPELAGPVPERLRRPADVGDRLRRD